MQFVYSKIKMNKWQDCLSWGRGTQLENCKENHVTATWDSGCDVSYLMKNYLK